MSFLNPVNEPVLRFSSTDAGAPQINYNTRVAGDVKTVLKACLVTGYGTKASAGWSIANEVDHVAEFVSPSVAMNDYRLRVDDNSTLQTTISCLTTESRLITNNSKTNPRISTTNLPVWTVLVSDSAVILIETVVQKFQDLRVARLTFFGLVKSTLLNNTEGFFGFAVGWGATRPQPSDLFNSAYANQRVLQLGGYTTNNLICANQSAFSSTTTQTKDVIATDFWSDVYVVSGNLPIAKITNFACGLVANSVDVFKAGDIQLNNRSCFTCFLTDLDNSPSSMINTGVNVAIYTDIWGH